MADNRWLSDGYTGATTPTLTQSAQTKMERIVRELGIIAEHRNKKDPKSVELVQNSRWTVRSEALVLASNSDYRVFPDEIKEKLNPKQQELFASCLEGITEKIEQARAEYNARYERVYGRKNTL